MPGVLELLCTVRAFSSIILLGARGFLGAHAARSLRRIDGLELIEAGRAPDAALRVDLNEPATFTNIAAESETAVIINCADSRSAPPIELARFCLHRGHTLLETSADTPTIAALHDLDVPDPRGTVILGVGLFPGVSNLLGATVHERRPGATRLDLAIRHDVLTQAGRGTCRLMAGALGEPARRYQDGELTLDPPIGGRCRFDFGDGPPGLAVRVGLPEGLMLHWSRGVPTTACYLAPKSALQARAAALGPPVWLARTRAMQGAMTASLTLFRRALVARRRSQPSVAVRATDDAGATTGVIHFESAFDAAGAGIAAIARRVLDRAEVPRGVVCADDVVSLDGVLEVINGLDCACRVDWIG